MSMETGLQIEELNIPDYERVIHATNSDTGLDCFIAIHSTELGPSIGGARFWKYDKSHDAIEDVLRLAEGMTFKNSLAGLNAGGGKAVINLRSVEKTPDLLKSFGEAVNVCKGTYITAEDVGSCPADMAVIAKTTNHVLTGSGDPSPATALGVVKGMEAAVNFYRHEMAPGQSLKDLKVALQGLGHVGFYLAEMLVKKGVQLIATDINKSLRNKAKKERRALQERGIEKISEGISAAKSITSDTQNDLETLKKLGKLRKAEVITEKEFQAKKKKILDRI